MLLFMYQKHLWIKTVPNKDHIFVWILGGCYWEGVLIHFFVQSWPWFLFPSFLLGDKLQHNVRPASSPSSQQTLFSRSSDLWRIGLRLCPAPKPRPHARLHLRAPPNPQPWPRVWACYRGQGSRSKGAVLDLFSRARGQCWGRRYSETKGETFCLFWLALI